MTGVERAVATRAWTKCDCTPVTLFVPSAEQRADQRRRALFVIWVPKVADKIRTRSEVPDPRLHGT